MLYEYEYKIIYKYDKVLILINLTSLCKLQTYLEDLKVTWPPSSIRLGSAGVLTSGEQSRPSYFFGKSGGPRFIPTCIVPAQAGVPSSS